MTGADLLHYARVLGAWAFIAHDIVLPLRYFRRREENRARDLAHTEQERANYYTTEVWHRLGLAAVIFLLAPTPRLATLGICLPNAEGWKSLGQLVVAVVGWGLLFISTERGRQYARRSLQPAAQLLPRTALERRKFAAFLVVSSLMEEIVYRGFYIAVFRDTFPGLHPLLIFILSAAVFGLHHIYQGPKGVFLAFFLGFIFSVMRDRHASLLVVAVLHTLVNLRSFFFTWFFTRNTPARPEPAIESPLREPPRDR